MAKKPDTETPKPDPRNRVVDALFALCAEHRFEEIGLDDIAARAEVSLADLRDLFPSKGAMLGGFIRRIDRIVLEGPVPSEATARERLEDLMIRRFMALRPHRAALRSLHDAFAHDVMGLAALNSQALNSWRYLLTSIGIETEGVIGYARLQGTILVSAKVFATFLKDENDDLSDTRAAIARELERAEWLMRRAEGLSDFVAPFKGFVEAWRETRARGKNDTPRGDAA